ncbi:MAG: hypothetical protein HUU10_09540 [Bacteroidetes bacterium]|nr:hypothetical protein [Bacteroidota bacterium]
MLAFLILAWSVFPGIGSDSTTTPASFQLSGGFGVCERVAHDSGSPTGFSFSLTLKRVNPRSADQFRFLYHEEFILLTDPVERYVDFSYLYHLLYPYRFGHLSAGAGIGFVSGTLRTNTRLPHPSGFGSTYESKSLSSIGLAGGAEFTFFFNERMGIGLLLNTFWCEQALINSGLVTIIIGL